MHREAGSSGLGTGVGQRATGAIARRKPPPLALPLSPPACAPQTFVLRYRLPSEPGLLVDLIDDEDVANMLEEQRECQAQPGGDCQRQQGGWIWAVMRMWPTCWRNSASVRRSQEGPASAKLGPGPRTYRPVPGHDRLHTCLQADLAPSNATLPALLPSLTPHPLVRRRRPPPQAAPLRAVAAVLALGGQPRVGAGAHRLQCPAVPIGELRGRQAGLGALGAGGREEETLHYMAGTGTGRM